MRVAAITALVLAVAPAVFAKSVVVSFKKGTSQSVVDEAKTKYKEAGGRITHEFHLIKYARTELTLLWCYQFANIVAVALLPKFPTKASPPSLRGAKSTTCSWRTTSKWVRSELIPTGRI